MGLHRADQVGDPRTGQSRRHGAVDARARTARASKEESSGGRARTSVRAQVCARERGMFRAQCRTFGYGHHVRVSKVTSTRRLARACCMLLRTPCSMTHVRARYGCECRRSCSPGRLWPGQVRACAARWGGRGMYVQVRASAHHIPPFTRTTRDLAVSRTRGYVRELGHDVRGLGALFGVSGLYG